MASEPRHVIVVHESEPFWSKSLLPIVNPFLAVIILILNIVCPGIGTMCLACLGPSCRGEHILVGLLQMILTVFLIGWIWSIMWGIFLVMKSRNVEYV